MCLVWGVAEEVLRLADMSSGATEAGGVGGGGGYGSGSGSSSDYDDEDGSEDEVRLVSCQGFLLVRLFCVRGRNVFFSWQEGEGGC